MLNVKQILKEELLLASFKRPLKNPTKHFIRNGHRLSESVYHDVYTTVFLVERNKEHDLSRRESREIFSKFLDRLPDELKQKYHKQLGRFVKDNFSLTSSAWDYKDYVDSISDYEAFKNAMFDGHQDWGKKQDGYQGKPSTPSSAPNAPSNKPNVQTVNEPPIAEPSRLPPIVLKFLKLIQFKKFISQYLKVMGEERYDEDSMDEVYEFLTDIFGPLNSLGIVNETFKLSKMDVRRIISEEYKALKNNG